MIEVRDLKRSFGPHCVLDGVTFQIEAGEAVVIMGRSGGGKSVLLKHLVGLLEPDAGEVRVEGQNIAHLGERQMLSVRSKFGVLFQGAALFDSLTVAENIGFALSRLRQFTTGEIARRVAEVLEMVELPGIQAKKPSELSGGMRKRVGLARAIIHRPAVVLYDEPTTGLDPVVSDSIDQLILRVCERLKVTSIVVTHDMRSARRVGQRILYLRDRRIYLDAPTEAVFASTDPVVHRFVNGISNLKEITFS
jgi:phospholipid/cholesterol/gamma-HCH transport system ATP-binding protein